MTIEAGRWVVDRLEADMAVLVSDDGVSMEVDRSALPRAAREGSVLRVPRDGAGRLRWKDAVVDLEETKGRRAEAESILDELRKRDPGGDVVL